MAAQYLLRFVVSEPPRDKENAQALPAGLQNSVEIGRYFGPSI